jgi:histidinol phosphatase-like PHP family hydrolase
LIGEGIVGVELSLEADFADQAGPVDLRLDAHVHTGFSVGRDAVGVVVSAADRAGLRALTFADQVGPDTAWLPAYAHAVRRAQQRTEMTLKVAAEVEIVQQDGWLAWPADLGDVDAVSVALGRLPLADGPVGPRDIRAMLADGALSVDDVVEIVVAATVQGVERAGRYAPTQLARPLNLLSQVGIDEAAVPSSLLDDLVEGCRVTNTLVEISEAWRSPSPRITRMFADAGVTVVPASDARYAAEVGVWQYLRTV